MSADSSPRVRLTVDTVQEWKDAVINKAFDVAAYPILMGTETRPTSTTKEILAYEVRSSKMVGYIRSTLDHGQIESIITPVGFSSLSKIWLACLDAYEAKNSGTRATILQELLALRKGSVGHEVESYADYGSRCLPWVLA